METLFQPRRLFLVLLFVTLFLFSSTDVYATATVGRAGKKATMTYPTNNLGMTAYWTFDGKDIYSNVRDRSGQGNTGYLVGTATTTVQGKIGQALDFSAISFVQATGTANAGTASTLTTPAINTNSGNLFIATYTWDNTSCLSCTVIISDNKGNTYTATASKQNDPRHGQNMQTFYVATSTGGAGMTFTATQSDLGCCRALIVHEVTGATANPLDKTDVQVADSGTSVVIGPVTPAVSGEYIYTAIDDDLSANGTFTPDPLFNERIEVAGQVTETQDALQTVSGAISPTWTMNNTDDVIAQMATFMPSNAEVASMNVTSDLIAGGDDSISVWLLPRSAPATSTIISNGQFMCGFNAAKTLFCSNDNGATVATSAAGALTLGTWQHFVGVRKSTGTFTLYLNGAVTGSADQSAGVVTAGSAMKIGRRSDNSQQYYGAMDDFRIYGRELLASEIAALSKIGTVTVSASKTAQMTNALVGYWTFDGKDMYTNVADKSGQGNTGYLAGSFATTTAPGKVGQAILFNGTNQYVRIPDVAAFHSNALTFAAWFRTSNPNSQTIVSKSWNGPPWSSPFITWLMRVNSPTLIEMDVGNGTAYSNNAVTVSTIQPNVWYHLAMTYDGASLISYLNGVAVGTPNTTVTGNLTYSATDVVIGADYSASPAGEYTAGAIDDVRIYNRALSATEIKNLYVLTK